MATDLLKPAAEVFSVSGHLQSFKFNIGGFDLIICECVIVQWMLVIVLGILFFVLGRNLSVKVTTKRQAIAEYIVGFFKSSVKDIMGEGYEKYTAYIGGLFCFSITSSLMGLFGLKAPTSDLSVVGTWALITFILTQRNKLKTGKIKGFLKSFTEPVFIMTPFNIIGEFANPVSLSLRHFANILGGSVIGGLIYFSLGQIAFGLASIGIPAILSLYFDLFSAVIQAYIFCTLTMAYIQGGEC